MLIPLSTDRPSARTAFTTPLLVGVCVALWLALEVLNRFDPALAGRIEAAAVLVPGQSPWYTYLTYAFLHAGFMHIAGNMLILWVFGPPVEDRLGRWWFLLFYLTGAAAAGGLHALFERAGVVGASGAIAAVTGAFLIMFPFTSVRCWFILFFSVSIVPAWWFIGLAMLWDLVLQGMGHGGGVARLAHLGGYILGAGVAVSLLASGLLPREPFDLFSMARRAHRRRQFREGVAEVEREGRRKAAQRDDGSDAVVAAARGRVQQALAAREAQALAVAYAELLRVAKGASPSLSVLPARQQMEMASLLHAAGQHQAAADAYSWFAAAYPNESETAHVRVLGALVFLRYVGDRHSARAMLDGLNAPPTDAAAAEMVRELRLELEAVPARGLT
ncbi:MAG: rhomboid family intramembrane serine protease [Phycisphaerales bacterium]